MSWKHAVSEAAAYYRSQLQPRLAGRRFILIGGPVAGLVGFGAELRSLGGEPFILGTSRGFGALPDPTEQPWLSLDLRARTMMQELHRSEARMRRPSRRLCAALDRFDPEGRARATGLVVMSSLPRVAGRRFYGGRLRRWYALEDKTRIDALWRAMGVASAPVRIVRAEVDALLGAHRSLDRGLGTVFSADAREGLNGGSEGVRRVRDESEARRAARELRRIADRVRVMPLLEGVPCSIHGIVLPGHTVALRPVEMLTLRRPDTGAFVYSGMGTTWDPPSRDRVAMRRLCRRTGEAIRTRVGFRGPFTIDGVLTASGFRPTELNARFGASMGLLAAGATGLPIAWLCLAAAAGEKLRYSARWLEEVMVEAADQRRAGRARANLCAAHRESSQVPVVAGRRGMRRARNRETPDGLFVLGPAASGGLLNYFPDARRLPKGARLAPHALRAFQWADQELGTGIGPLEIAAEAGSAGS